MCEELIVELKLQDNVKTMGLLSSPDVSLDAQSVDPRPSCEACLCRVEFV